MNPRILQREQHPDVHQAAVEAGYSPLQARILAGRLKGWVGDSIRDHVSPSLSQLDPPDLLPDIATAAARIARAIIEGEHLISASDHDCDGSNSNSIIYTALTDFFNVPKERVHVFLSHRLKEGYGISDTLTDRMLEQLASIPRPAVLVTSDQGSTDEARFKRIKAEGIDIIVTDHHGVPESGPPPSALACVNPNRADSQFPDRAIAGCHVAWLTMCAVRRVLIACQYLPNNAPSLAPLLCWASLGTSADCVSMATSRNNRAILRYGMWLMNNRPRECWKSLAVVSGINGQIKDMDLSHLFGPRINASGRIDDAKISLQFLVEQDPLLSIEMAQQLNTLNTERKQIQKQLVTEGLDSADEQANAGEPAIVVFYPEGHTGVHGITASRYVEAFGRPVVCFSPKHGQPDIISGSFRSIPGVHIRQALQWVSTAHPDLLLTWGGHEGAAGATIRAPDLEAFTDAFRAAVALQKDPATMGPLIYSDGPLEGPPTLDDIADIEAIGPYGRDFDPPSFDGRFNVSEVRAVGDGRHLKLVLADDAGQAYQAIWFGARESSEEPMPLRLGQRITVIYQIKENTFRGRTTIDLQIRHVETLHDHHA